MYRNNILKGIPIINNLFKDEFFFMCHIRSPLDEYNGESSLHTCMYWGS